jgi:hypothetical protein
MCYFVVFLELQIAEGRCLVPHIRTEEAGHDQHGRGRRRLGLGHCHGGGRIGSRQLSRAEPQRTRLHRHSLVLILHGEFQQPICHLGMDKHRARVNSLRYCLRNVLSLMPISLAISS